MRRRTAIKMVALGSLGVSGEWPLTAWSAQTYQLRFFTAEENAVLEQLMDLVIPADAHSPGARAAQVSLFADLMVATSSEAIRTQWREGLQLMQAEAAHSSLAEALAKAAAHEAHPTTSLEHFFAALKRMTVNGYYTSEIGIHQDLQYQGNTYLSQFPGCTLPAAKTVS
jgi:Gluconate 2-dehydrogenase subunit 3